MGTRLPKSRKNGVFEDFNIEEFRKLCLIQCTRKEIALWFNVSEQTMNQWCYKAFGKTFSEAQEDYAGEGFISLRRKMFGLALEGHWPALQFLAKNYLGMTENVNVNVTAKVESMSDDELLEKARTIIERIDHGHQIETTHRRLEGPNAEAGGDSASEGHIGSAGNGTKISTGEHEQ